ncbi:MAG: hypothetical protein Q8P31_13445 [Bacillota bacterium]|nr:hypothetical protein [Bacillota bacterium]
MAGKYESYRRIHKAAHASDLEKGKIGHETARLLKADRKAQALCRRIAARPDDDTTLDEFQAQALAAQRESRNAKGHKTRLKQLLKEKDFV